MSIKQLGRGLLVGLSLIWLAACSTTDKSSDAGTTDSNSGVVTDSVDAGPSAEELARQQAEKLRSEVRVIYFEFDKYEIQSEFRAALAAHGEFIAANPNVTVKLKGHADERGTPGYNLALGEKRAKAVAQILANYGVSSSQVETISYGEEQPANPGHNEAAWAENRRVEIDY